MNEVHIYFMTVMLSIGAYLAFTIKALMIYQNITILVYTLIIGILIASVLLSIKPFSTGIVTEEVEEE